MCFGKGNEEDPDAKKSREIEKQLREDQKRAAKEVKLLLLGTSFLLRKEDVGSESGILTTRQERESPANRRCSSRCD